MDEKKIKRINELYSKSKLEGLTPDEAAEQKALRTEYVLAVRANLRGTLNQISFVNPDGSITPLAHKEKEKRHEME